MSVPSSIAIVGGSLAGVSAARALRDQGFAGRVSVIADEDVAAYDRPPLSKGYLLGDVSVAELALLDDPGELDLDWRHGVAAALRPGLGGVELGDGTLVTADAVVLATGARARRPWPHRAGVHVLRTLTDATALRDELRPGARVVVVGAGYLGAEVASSAHSLGLDVTVVEAGSTPLTPSLGRQVGAAVAGLHAAHGVALHCGTGVVGFTGGHRVEGVELVDGRVLPADTVVVAVGAVPNTEWLVGSGVQIAAGGVSCDAYGTTTIPDVVAVGDCAAWYDPQLGTAARLEHWTSARERAVIAMSSLLSGGTVRTAGRPPYVWSDQYGARVQITGHPQLADSVTVEHGSLEAVDFVAAYRRGGEIVAAAAVGHAGSFMRLRKALAARSRGPVPAPDAVSTDALSTV